VGVQVIAERGKAIAHAVQTAQAGDLVLIAGKGHETYQIVGTQTQHFSDREQAEAVLGVAL
jgi:UDP-N-acetylmuramoyl-L-alanyl-D-glutamate--2,6-diaminopimelate ligase